MTATFGVAFAMLLIGVVSLLIGLALLVGLRSARRSEDLAKEERKFTIREEQDRMETLRKEQERRAYLYEERETLMRSLEQERQERLEAQRKADSLEQELHRLNEMLGNAPQESPQRSPERPTDHPQEGGGSERQEEGGPIKV